MPIIDLAPRSVLAAVDTPKGFAVTPGKLDIDYGSDAPDGSVLGAAFRQDNTVGAFLASEDMPTHKESGYDGWSRIKGTRYEAHWESFAGIHNNAAHDAMVRKLDRELEDRRILDAAPLYQSLPAQMVAGAIDLPSLLPGGAFVRGARGGFSLGRSALSVGTAAGISSSVQEAALQELVETRTAGESALNIGASVFVGGMLGAAGSALLTRAEWSRAVRAVESELAAMPADPGTVPVSPLPRPASAGAAAVEAAGIDGNTIAGRAAGVLAATTERLNPALRLLRSPSPLAREVATQLFENSVYLRKNFEGVASEPAVETLQKEWNSGLAIALQATRTTWREMRKAGSDMTELEFREAVGIAMRRLDSDPLPEVAGVAKIWRSQVFDPLKEAAIAAKLLPEDVHVDTAASYLSRLWNRGKLIAREGEFKEIVQRWVMELAPRLAHQFDRETAVKSAKLTGDKLKAYQLERRLEREARFEDAPGAARAVAVDVFNKLTGRATTESGRPEFLTVTARGPLKERTLDIPDELVLDFIESDVELDGRRYVRIMGADVELAGKFGRADMRDQLQAIRDDFARLREGVADEKALTKLGKQEKAALQDIESLRDLLRHGTIYNHPVEENFTRAARWANHVNYLRLMGEVVLASLTDAIRPAMVHGLSAYMQGVGQLATNLSAVRMSVAEARLAGNVAEQILAHRLGTLTEIVDPYSPRGPVDAMLTNLTNVASRWNGIRVWTDMTKGFASVLTQNRILTGAESFASIKPRERAYLAYLGIDESMAERIAAQFVVHGDTLDGVRVANTEAWTDQAAVHAYRAAINKDLDSIIVQKSVADVPLFASTPTGRLVLQFKTFALASHQKILLRGLQEDQSRFVGGLVAMTTLGMMIAWLKAISGNRQERLAEIGNNPGWWIAEGLDRSGILSVPMELANTFEKLTGANPIKAPIKAFDEGAAASQKMQFRNKLGSALGPTAGMIEDILTVTSIPQDLMSGEEITQGKRNSAQRLVPFHTYAGVRQLLNFLINPQQ